MLVVGVGGVCGGKIVSFGPLWKLTPRSSSYPGGGTLLVTACFRHFLNVYSNLIICRTSRLPHLVVVGFIRSISRSILSCRYRILRRSFDTGIENFELPWDPRGVPQTFDALISFAQSIYKHSRTRGGGFVK